MNLFPRNVPAAPAGIDLRCCGVDELLPTLAPGSFDFVVADPPWDAYTQRPGSGIVPDEQYSCLSMAEISAHLSSTAVAAKPGARLLVWYTWPLAREWMAETMGGSLKPWVAKSGGAWTKDRNQPGPGFHWSGESEPVELFTKPGAPAWRDTKAMCPNAWVSAPAKHSEKPTGWYRLMLRRFVPPGGRVLEIYAGLGSLARACLAEGVEYVGCEIDPTRHADALTALAQRRGL